MSTTLHIESCQSLKGQTTIPGDKSISHRALMFATLAKGQSTLHNLLEGHDCMATISVLRSLGAHIELKDKTWTIRGNGPQSFVEPDHPLNCKNSGTTIRLLAGLLSSMPFMSILDGTAQIKRRPMGRVIAPLQQMGARIFGRHGDKLAPVCIFPSKLQGIEHTLPVKSAQIKSALILAGLFAHSPTTVENCRSTRDHSENLLRFMGADIETKEDSVLVHPLKHPLKPIELTIPGDISSAAFLLVAGSIVQNASVMLKHVGVNETRTGIIDALHQMGAQVVVQNRQQHANEYVADIHVETSKLQGCTFSGEHIVRMIDEIPILAVAATQSHGTTIIKDAQELKVKESNRIEKTVLELSKMKARIRETSDGMIIEGPTPLVGATVDSHGDHRLAMALSIAGFIAEGPTRVLHAGVTDDSFPGFVKTLTELGANIQEEHVVP